MLSWFWLASPTLIQLDMGCEPADTNADGWLLLQSVTSPRPHAGIFLARDGIDQRARSGNRQLASLTAAQSRRPSVRRCEGEGIDVLVAVVGAHGFPRRLFSSAAERLQEGEGNVELVHDPYRLVSQSNFTMKLSGKGAE